MSTWVGVCVLVAVVAAGMWFGMRWASASALLDAQIAQALDRPADGLRRRPEGVRIVHADGTETLCEPVFSHVDGDGCAVWAIATPFDPATEVVRVAMMPGRTGLAFPMMKRQMNHD